MSQEKTTNRKKCTCLRCGWEWFPVKDGEPKTCTNPKCRSPYWNKERVYKWPGKPAPTSKSKRKSAEPKNDAAQQAN